MMAGSLFAQTGVKTSTDQKSGQYRTIGACSQIQNHQRNTTDLDVIWQINEPYAVIGSLGISDVTQKSFANWQLNDGRLALYGDSNIAEWEFATTADWPRCAGNEAGSLYVVADETLVNVLDPTTGASINSFTLAGGVTSLAVRSDGTGFFISYANGDKYSIAAYTSTNSSPVWTIDGCTSSIAGISVQEDDIRLIASFTQPTQAIWVIDSETGEVLQDDIYYYDNSPTQAPALSTNGEYLTFSDFSGKASLYHWNGEKYELVWKADVTGTGSSSTWGCGNAISADGSLIAIGTLDFVSDGYDGAIYLFNNYSPDPIWVFENTGDEVSQISMSDDGSLIACASYGPLNHSKPDFYLFRKQSNEPIGSLNTTGSMECVEMSGDGTRCFVAGKAVHVREMGYGSNGFYINCIPANTGSLAGIANLLDNSEDNGVTVTIEGIDNYFETTAIDGSYIIKYVPSGTYTVTFSKPGYYPQSFDNVVISSGETATLNAELEATGQSVSNLYASQGAYNYVRLTWDSYPETCNGYNVYRKGSINAPFESPIATIGSETSEYLDATVIPTNTYYYAVTAVLDADIETPYSNVAMGYTSTTAIVSDIDVFDGIAPTIDGLMSENEWSDAFTVDVSNYLSNTAMGSVILHFKMDNDYLYVCSENHCDTEFNDNEGVAFYIDDNNDGSFPEPGDDSEGNYWMYYGSNGNTVRYRPIYNTSGVGEVIYLPEEIIAASLSEGYEIIEFALPFGSEQPWQINPISGKSGLYLFVRDALTANMYGKWPSGNDVTFAPTYYGVMNYHVEDEIPPAPENLIVDNEVLSNGIFAPVSWEMPNIHDLGHFNVYVNSNSVTNQTNGTQIILDIEENTTYNVFVTTVDAAGQESGHSETLTFTSGNVDVNEVNVSTFTVYPNPAKSTVFITSDIHESGTVKVMDISGRIINTLTCNDLTSTKISVEGLESGLYFAIVNYGNTIVIRKFMIE